MSSRFSSTEVAKQLDYCTYCPKMCRHACPVSTTTGRESLIPQAKMDRLNGLLRGGLPWTAESCETLWACTGCRQCTVYCEHGNEPGMVLFAGRATANARGAGHPNLAEFTDRFRNRDQRLAGELHANVDEEQFAETGRIGFWPGCDAVDKGMNDIIGALTVFDQISVETVKLVDAGQVCAGYPLLAGGYPDMFRWHAGKVAVALKRFETVVVNCSACLHTLRSSYPAEGVQVSPNIVSLAEYLADLVDSLPVPDEPRVVYYHDPCYLARYEGVIDEPRRILGKIAEVREFVWSKEDAECCGGAGLLPKTQPQVADAMAKRRLRDVANRGGGTIVTSCATCAFMLKRNAPSNVVVSDLPGFVADVLRQNS